MTTIIISGNSLQALGQLLGYHHVAEEWAAFESLFPEQANQASYTTGAQAWDIQWERPHQTVLVMVVEDAEDADVQTVASILHVQGWTVKTI